MRRSRVIISFAALLLIGGAGLTLAVCRAADPQNPADKPSSDEATKAAHEDSSLAKIPTAVPNGTPEELLEFIDQLSAMAPPEKPDDVKSFVEKTRGLMLKASDKILDSKPDEKVRIQAVHAKLNALIALMNFAGDEHAEKNLRAFASQLSSDKDAGLAKLGSNIGEQLQMRDLMDGQASAEAREKVWNKVKEKLTADPDDASAIRMAQQVAYGLSMYEDTKPAIQAYKDLAKILGNSTDESAINLFKHYDGIMRRLELPGHPIELKGKLVDGKTFDPDSLKGKVVLVDFWATWCGPCRAELPNVKRNYAKYHDKGFDVIGISLDDGTPEGKETLQKVIADEKISWPVIFGGGDPMDGWSQPNAVYYGITSIPATILVDQKGNVVSLNARGPKLGELLAKLLGG